MLKSTDISIYRDNIKKFVKTAISAVCASALILTAAPAIPSTAAEPIEAGDEMANLVTSDRVNFRAKPSTECEVLEIIAAGTDVRVSECSEDGWDTVIHDGVTGYIKDEYLITREEYNALPASKLELLEWSKAKFVLRIGADLKILDVRSGKVYYVRSFSNGNHADVEPITKEDTAILKATYGGRWSWDPRPVWVFIDGRVLAASINGMPHGGGVNGNNGMNGQVCLHFKGSTTHNGNKRYAAEMQAAVVEAWGYK